MVKSYAKKRVLSSFLNLAGSAVSRMCEGNEIVLAAAVSNRMMLRPDRQSVKYFVDKYDVCL